MSVEEIALAEIMASPEDDVPRLIFADWLEEHGDEARAEFIRVQVELALPKNRVAVQMEEGARLAIVDGMPLPEHLIIPERSTCFITPGNDSLAASKSIRMFSGPALLTSDFRDVQPLKERLGRLLSPGNFWQWFGHLAGPFAGSPTVRIGGTLAQVSYGDTGDESCWRLILERGFVARVRMPEGHWIEYGPAFRQPLELVELGDKKPWHGVLSPENGDVVSDLVANGYEWAWVRTFSQAPLAVIDAPEVIDARIWPHLTANAYAQREYSFALLYKSEQEAYNALSAACLLYAEEARR